MIQSGASLTPMEHVREVGPTAWFQAYLPGEPDIITPLVNRAQATGFEVLVLTVDVQVSANRENNVRAGYSSPLKPTLRLAWDGMVRPHWLLGTFARTILNHGMPHLENMGFPRIPILGNIDRPRMGLAVVEIVHHRLERAPGAHHLLAVGVEQVEEPTLAGKKASEHGRDSNLRYNAADATDQ